VFEASYAANSMFAIYGPTIGLLMALGYYIIWLFGGHQILNRIPVAGQFMTSAPSLPSPPIWASSMRPSRTSAV